ncbi:MAG TPA: MBL fold metallo-hydrolase, partial [Burkholderiales bacterium]|nr:MBL fold metallo-hydrolase [Burkholderiales bacterium]
MVSSEVSPKVSLEYPWPETPPPGETIAVAPGIHWLSMPLPFQLDHINLWLVEDADRSGSGAAAGGWTVVDTGIGDQKTRSLWETLFAKFHPVKRVILTHYHPDHAGNAEWICKRFGVEMWTTQGEYLTAHAVRASSAGYTSDAVLSVFKKNGLPADKTAAMAAIRGNNRYSALVPEFPFSYRRIIEGDKVRIGGHDWEAIVGHGHAPEHL